jgi:aminoglycoside phosphotransferase (APT) family kinase protein
MALTVPEAKAPLEDFLAAAAGAKSATIEDFTLLSGGTLQENWRFQIVFRGGPEDGVRALVLRANRAAADPLSLSRSQEFAVMKAAHDAGVATPEPLWESDGKDTLGRAFLIMRHAAGSAAAHRIVRDEAMGGNHDALAERMGEELARIQAITPAEGGLGFLRKPENGAAATIIAEQRAYLDGHPDPHPAIEWGLTWTEANLPEGSDLVLCHGDFRTGNFLVDGAGLTGIVDWELASWGDPMEDLAWFCLKFWRFGRWEREAGGLADREHFYRGYERVSGRRVDPVQAHYWDVLANLRWAVVSMRQAERHLSGRDPSLQLALTGRMTAEMELEALRLIEAGPPAQEGK